MNMTSFDSLKHEIINKRGITNEQNEVISKISPQKDHSVGQSKNTKDTHVRSEMTTIKVRVTSIMMQLIEDEVEYVGQWPNKSEFVRDAIRNHITHWIDEMRLSKSQFEEEESYGASNMEK